MRTTTITKATMPATDDLAILEAELVAAEVEGERLRAEELALYAVLPQGAGLPRPGVTAVEVIRARQRLPGLRTELENNLLGVADLSARVTAARALAHAAIRRDFAPRKLAAGARVDEAMEALEVAMAQLVEVEDDEAVQLGHPRPIERGLSLALSGWVETGLRQELHRTAWQRAARAAGWLP